MKPYHFRKTFQTIYCITAALACFGILICCASAQASVVMQQSYDAASLFLAADEALSELSAYVDSADTTPSPLLSEFLLKTQTAAEIARTGETPEQRVHLFIEHLGIDCSQLLISTAIALVVDLFDIIPYDYLIVRILAAATLLCYLGIF